MGACLCHGEGADTGVEKELFTLHIDGCIMLFEEVET